MSSEWKTLRELIETRGINGKVIVSAELGLNHNGDVRLAMKMIEAAAEVGCQAVKVQNYRTGDLMKHRLETLEIDGILYNGWKLFSRCELDYSTLSDLKLYADKCGLIFHSTPTNEQGVRDLRKLGCQTVKIASDVAQVPDLLEYAERQFGDDVIASLGCLEPWQIEHHAWVWLHCVREYPTVKEKANLSRIAETRLWLKKLTADALVGYSDHTEGIDCALAAVRDYKACWLECHVTLDHTLPGPDHRWSKDFTQMAELVRCLKR